MLEFHDSYIACICEGASEVTVMDILLDRGLLLFGRNQLLGESVLSSKFFRDPELFCRKYLTMDYEGKRIIVLLVQDRKNTSYGIKRPYLEKVSEFVYVITAPEIEMLMIHSLGFYNDYKKQASKKKPSTYLAEKIKKRSSAIKSRTFIEEFYEEHDLVNAIREHRKKSQKLDKGIFLADILTN